MQSLRLTWQSIFRPITLGFAMFSMFFGSGNTVFPVLIGRATQDNVLWGVFGLLITAVLVPFMGLLVTLLFKGNYEAFFSKLGRIPGFFIILLIMGLTGPLGGIPRCIVISFGTISPFVSMSSLTFTLMSAAIIFICTIQRTKIIDILGVFLTHILLLAVFLIIISGLISPDLSDHSIAISSGAYSAFRLGLLEGYNTLDLFAAFLFSGVILEGITCQDHNILKHPKKLTRTYLQASLVGMILLSAIYTGLSLISSRLGSSLLNIPADQILNKLAVYILGANGAIVVCIAVSLACLTTAITLSLVFSDFLAKSIFRDKVSYRTSLAITVFASFIMSNLEFQGIQAFIAPILQLSLPSFIVLSLVNFSHKLIGWRYIKAPVFATFVITCFCYYSY